MLFLSAAPNRLVYSSTFRALCSGLPLLLKNQLDFVTLAISSSNIRLTATLFTWEGSAHYRLLLTVTIPTLQPSIQSPATPAAIQHLNSRVSLVLPTTLPPGTSPVNSFILNKKKMSCLAFPTCSRLLKLIIEAGTGASIYARPSKSCCIAMAHSLYR